MVSLSVSLDLNELQAEGSPEGSKLMNDHSQKFVQVYEFKVTTHIALSLLVEGDLLLQWLLYELQGILQVLVVLCPLSPFVSRRHLSFFELASHICLKCRSYLLWLTQLNLFIRYLVSFLLGVLVRGLYWVCSARAFKHRYEGILLDCQMRHLCLIYFAPTTPWLCVELILHEASALVLSALFYVSHCY